jgi:hypothetical protein
VLACAPTHLLPLAVAAQLRTYFDLVLKVHAFTDPASCLTVSREGAGASSQPGGGAAGTAPEFAEYTGLLLLRRLPRLGALVSFQPDTLTYAFKRDRRKMTIEKPYLPPEDDRTAGTAPGAPAAAAGQAAATPGASLARTAGAAARAATAAPSAAGGADARLASLRMGRDMGLGPGLGLAGMGAPGPGASRSGLRGLLMQDDEEGMTNVGGVPGGAAVRRPPLRPGMGCASGRPGGSGSTLDF